MGYLLNRFVAELIWKMEYRAAVRQANKIQRHENRLKKNQVSRPGLGTVTQRV